MPDPFNPKKARAKRPLPFWVDAFVRKTLHLDMAQIGAYLTILYAMWGRESCDLPANDVQLAALCRVSKTKWMRHFKPVLWGYFDEIDGRIVSKRLQKEASFVEKTLAAQSERKRAGKTRKPPETKELPLSTDTSTDTSTVGSGELPTQQPNNPREEDKSSSKEAADYERYLKAHPNPVESNAGELAFSALVESGEDPARIIAAATAYAETAKGWSAEAKVQQSDNFLLPDRGKWKEHIPAPKAAPISREEKMAYWAKSVNEGRFVSANSITPSLAREMISAGLVTPEKLKERGIAA